MRRLVLWGLLSLVGLIWTGQPINSVAAQSGHPATHVATNGPGDPGPEVVNC